MEYYNRTDLNYLNAVRDKILRPIVKVELLDEYEHSYCEIIQEISSESQGTITQNLQQGVRKSINFSIFDPEGKFFPNPNDKYFWINKRFKIYVGLIYKTYEKQENPLLYSRNANDIISTTNPITRAEIEALKIGDSVSSYREDYYWFSKGIFIITNINCSSSNGEKIVNISGIDKFGLFTNDTGYNEMIGTFALEKGTEISFALKEILNQDIGNGSKLDPSEPIIDPFFVGYKLPLEISKGPSSYIGDLLEDLANSLHADIFYDDEGHLNFWQSLNSDEYKNVGKQWDYHLGDQEYLSATVNYEILNVANSIYVVGDNPSAKILPSSWAENTSPISPLSIQKIGRKTRYIESSSIQTQKEAADYARYILKTSSLLGNTINFNSTLIPHLNLDGVITITDDNLKYLQEEFIITSITYPIGLGEMQISGSSIKELPEG